MEDLNLTTKLEYALQPIRRETVDLAEIGRQAVSEVLNSGLPERYEIDFLRSIRAALPGWRATPPFCGGCWTT